MELLTLFIVLGLAALYSIVLLAMGFAPEDNLYFGFDEEYYNDVSTVDTKICNSPKMTDNKGRKVVAQL